MKKSKNQSLKFLKGEKWKELSAKKGTAGTKRYAISNYGRIASFAVDLKEGSLLKPRLTQGYPSVTISRQGKKKNYYLHRLVAQYFLTKSSPKQTFVIHKDHQKENNNAKNLKWVTQEQQIEHAKKDPAFINRKRPEEGHKLTIDKVRQIKKKLFESKKQPTLKALAQRYGVSDMQIFRIKTGENWSHVEV